MLINKQARTLHDYVHPNTCKVHIQTKTIHPFKCISSPRWTIHPNAYPNQEWTIHPNKVKMQPGTVQLHPKKVNMQNEVKIHPNK